MTDASLDRLIANAEHGESCRDCFVGEPHACPDLMNEPTILPCVYCGVGDDEPCRETCTGRYAK